MATCFLKQKTSAFTWKRYENFTEGLTPRQEPGVEQADQPENLSFAGSFLAATHVGNYALFTGGYNYDYQNVVDAYNVSLERSAPTPLSVARRGLVATHVGNYALFAGGNTNNGNISTVDAYQENQEVCDFPVIPNSIYKFEPYGSETTASEFSKVTVNYPVNGYVKYISTTLN